MNQKLPFPSLIFGHLESQKPLQRPNEFLSALVQHVFRFKEKGDVTEGEQDYAIATENVSVATEEQPIACSSSSVVVQLFFKVVVRTIKEKQVQQDQKLDKVTTQL